MEDRDTTAIPAASGVIMHTKIFRIPVLETSWSAVGNLQTSKTAMLWLLFTSAALDDDLDDDTTVGHLS